MKSTSNKNFFVNVLDIFLPLLSMLLDEITSVLTLKQQTPENRFKDN